MTPARLKLTTTVMSIGSACDSGGGFQQECSRTKMSFRVSSCAGCAVPGAIDASHNSSAANQRNGLLRGVAMDYLMSEATCTFTILSGSVTCPPDDPGGAFFSLSTTSMPETTSPMTVYWPLRLEPSANMMKNCEFAVSTLSPRRAMPTMPRVNGTLENSCFRFGYFDPPVPLKFWPSPVCAMKPSITRWNGTLL